MNKTKIEWCDYTFNPVTGCLHNCDYCYARRIANRFGKHEKPLGWEPGFNVELLKKYDNPYPYDFIPTFHKYRLNEPQQVNKPSKIFVCSMADLFGDWVPDEWIQEVFKACQKADWHQYLFLTKNPKRYSAIYRSEPDYRWNMWFGTTVADDDSFIHRGADLFQNTGCDSKRHAKRFLSIEPLLGRIDDHRLRTCIRYLDWVILGQKTGPGAVPPKDEWVQSIIDQCRAAGVPVFVKRPLYEKFPIQEWPEGLK